MGNICCNKELDSRGTTLEPLSRSSSRISTEGRRVTLAPNMKNFKNLKHIDNISDLYSFGDMLGEGSFGKVMKAVRIGSSSEFAVKYIEKDSLNSNPMLPKLMLNELTVLQKSSHPGIMNVVELLEDNDYFYIVTELLSGGELFDRIIEVGSFSEVKAAKIIKQVLLALNYMHSQKMTHRDLKPENILLESSNIKNLDVKIADFGFSCFFDPKEGLDLVLGSPLYMAPEIIQGRNYNEKVDIWSMGVISYMLLSGRNPFPGKTKDEVKRLICKGFIDMNKPAFQKVSDDAKDFISKALIMDVKKRYSAKQLLNHPWMQEMSLKFDKQLDDEGTLEVLQHLKDFSKATKFQKTIMSVLCGLKADKDELKKMKVAFMQMDTNQDGTLSMEEIKEAESKLKGLKIGNKWQDVLKQCDLDGDGKIDFHEFFTAAIDHKKVLTKQNLSYAFQTFDTNGDGSIDIEEFKVALPSSSTRKLSKSDMPRGRGSKNSLAALSTKDTLNSQIISGSQDEDD